MRIKAKVHYFFYRIFTCLYGLFNPLQKRILFTSFGGKQYSDNPRAISETMHRLYPDYEIMWSLSNKEDKYNMIPSYVNFVPDGRLSFYKALATSFCFITNDDIKPYIYKNRKQLFIQTWHGDRGFKKVLYDSINATVTEDDINVIDNKVTDICIAASDFGESVYRSAFRYNGKIIKKGMPRNDALVRNSLEEKQQIKKRLSIIDEKILIYAPTFRETSRKNQEALVNLVDSLDILENSGEKWICLVRAHSAASNLINIEKDSRIINVSDYPDMADLLLVADMLITDYSSCACDYVLTGNPVIIAAFDKEEYQKNCREFKVDPRDAHFFVVENQDELNCILKDRNSIDFRQNCKEVCDYYRTYEFGHSSELICNIIEEYYRTGKIGV